MIPENYVTEPHLRHTTAFRASFRVGKKNKRQTNMAFVKGKWVPVHSIIDPKWMAKLPEPKAGFADAKALVAGEGLRCIGVTYKMRYGGNGWTDHMDTVNIFANPMYAFAKRDRSVARRKKEKYHA
jgi:hypothetical protein